MKSETHTAQNVEQDLRERLTKVAQMAWDAGLTTGSGGNISARIPGTNTCLIKPHGFRFDATKPADFIIVDINTRKNVKGDLQPSVETPFHTSLYKERSDVGGVVHTHSHYGYIMGIANIDLVPLGMSIAGTPGLAKGVKIAGEYVPAGTEELCEACVKGMKGRVATILPHHGVVAIGKDIEEAYRIALATENLAKLQYEVMCIGKPVPIAAAQVKKMLERGKERGAIL